VSIDTHIRTRVGGNAAAHGPLTPKTVPRAAHAQERARATTGGLLAVRGLGTIQRNNND
jgi:hypothetical protein